MCLAFPAHLIRSEGRLLFSRKPRQIVSQALFWAFWQNWTLQDGPGSTIALRERAILYIELGSGIIFTPLDTFREFQVSIRALLFYI